MCESWTSVCVGVCARDLIIITQKYTNLIFFPPSGLITSIQEQLTTKHTLDEFSRCMRRIYEDCQPFYMELVKVLQGNCGNALRDFFTNLEDHNGKTKKINNNNNNNEMNIYFIISFIFYF